MGFGGAFGVLFAAVGKKYPAGGKKQGVQSIIRHYETGVLLCFSNNL